MTEISVIAERVGTVYNVPIQLGMDYFDAKFDTGSSIHHIKDRHYSRK